MDPMVYFDVRVLIVIEDPYQLYIKLDASALQSYI